MTSEQIEQLDELLAALRDDVLTDEQTARLDEILAGDASARVRYVQYLQLCDDLRRDYSATDIANDPIVKIAVSKPEQPVRPRPNVLYTMSKWVAMAACVAILASWVTVSLLPKDPVIELPWLAEGEAGGVAVLTQVANLDWESTKSKATVGTVLKPGPLRLDEGIVQIEFYSGATVVIEGPAEFEIVSAERGVLKKGKLRAHVPPQARGFTIDSAGLEVVDLGTEFGMSVEENEKPEIHVFDGEVELHGAVAGAVGALRTGQAVRFIGEELDVFASDHSSFVDPARLAGMADERFLARRSQWYELSRSLRSDPSVMLHYTFDHQQPWDRTVYNHASGPESFYDGAIVGAQWSDGRWPGKSAIEFKRSSDRIRVNVPGKHEAITFSTWVRFDGFDRQYSSLLLTDGFETGEPHWQVEMNGKVVLGVKGENGTAMNFYSAKRVLSQSDLGRWVHIVSVYDSTNGIVQHYLNGQPVDTVRVPIGATDVPWQFVPIEIGAGEIGNWAAWGQANPTGSEVRNMNGRMDDFLLVSRAMTASEIRNMYDAGKPYR